jgi:hypothetical protein
MRFGFLYGVTFWYVLLLPLVVLVGWATLDALVRPDSDWAAADQSKTAWVVGLLLGSFGLAPVGILVALVYLFGVRPRLTAAARGSLSRRAPA